MVNDISDITLGMFEHLNIIAKNDVDKKVKYIEYIITGPALNNYREILLVCKDMSKRYSGDQCMLRDTKNVSMDSLWAWSKVVVTNNDRDPVSRADHCNYFENEPFFGLGKIMWQKHQYNFQDHVNYIYSDIVKPFMVGIIQYSKRVHEMHELDNYFPPYL